MHAGRSTGSRRRRWVTALAATTLVLGTLVVVEAATVAAPAQALDNHLARTPPMGFNDWNAFGCNVEDQLIRQTADLFVSSGLKAAGYTFVNIDDCWMTRTRSSDGHLVPDPAKFPEGMKATADYVHSQGLKIGIYEDAGTQTCAGFPGSLGHEQTDATDFATWGIDYLKYDNCNNASDGTLADYQSRYTAMGDALKATGRPIVYSICEWGVNDPASWAGSIGNLWRTTGDINDSWGSLKSIIDQNAPLAYAAKPGAWNDPDMLEVGNGGMTQTEYQTHFGLWAVMAAPLLIGTDLRQATPATMAIYLNQDVIAVDQDRLGVQGQVIADRNGTKVFTKPLANGDRAVALYNSTDVATTISTTTAQVGLPRAAGYTMKDLWSKATTETAGTISASVPAHGTVLLRVRTTPGWSSFPPSVALAATSPTAYSGADAAVSPGGTTTVTTTVGNAGKDPLSSLRVTTAAPSGWSVTATSPWSRATLRTGGTFATTWTVTVPPGTAPGPYAVPVTTTYAWGARSRVVATTRALTVEVVAPPPPGASPLSDVAWVSATNGWGPVEKDMSNGETAAGDGKPITIRGAVFAKGLGVNATSDIVYYLGGACSSLTTTVGIDDEVAASGGNVIFQVFAGDTKVADSGAVTNTSPAMTLTADLTGAAWLRLHVDPNGPTTFDHADWAGPVLTCAAP